MFSMIWRFFPGPAWLRVIVIVIAAVALVYALTAYVYPWFAAQIPEQPTTVNS